MGAHWHSQAQADGKVAMIEFKFLVAQEDIKGIPGLMRGDGVIRTTVEVMPGGYEYDVWEVISGLGAIAKTRIAHRDKFAEITVDGKNRKEIRAKVESACDGFRRVDD